jgi:phenylacetate-CoA ligase
MIDPGPIEQARWLNAGGRLPRKELLALQRARLEALVAHARQRSPYYREVLPDGPVELAALPTLDKTTLMERFDDIVCDPRLHRDALLEHVGGPGRHTLHLDEYRVMRTSGASGRRGLFVYDTAGWAGYVGQFLSVTALLGMPLWERRGVRVGVVSAGDPAHASAQVAVSCVALGLAEIHPLPVTLPLDRIVDALNETQPEWLHAYASYAALLADERLAGRLRITPRLVTTSSELLTADMARRIEMAFGVRAFDFYASTEGVWAAQCPEHQGFHLFEPWSIVENVDAEGRPVPDGERGVAILVTNLFNRVQPLIRYEIPDVVTIEPAPCPCGRTLRRIAAVHGRDDDLLRLGGVIVHPLQFAALAADAEVREFQVVQRGERLTLRLVVADGAPVGGTCERMRDRVAAALRGAGVAEPRLDVESCAAIDRPPSGKLQLVVAGRP